MTKEEIREMSLELDRLREENEYLREHVEKDIRVVKMLCDCINFYATKEEPCR